jgi:hypothetical protein
MRESIDGGLDLSVVDQAYGDFADLYSDVLRVSVVATHEQIQLAYFDRRSELFTLLAKIDSKAQDEHTAAERFQAERKMDSVVLAVRVLGDPDQRLQYDRMRQERLLNRRRAEHGQLPGHEPNARVGAGLDSVTEDEYQQLQQQQNKKEKRKSSRRSKEHRDRSTEPVESSDKKKKDKKSKHSKKQKKQQQQPVEEPSLDPLSPEEESEIMLNRSHETQETGNLTADESDRGDRSLLENDTDEMRQDDNNTTSCGGTDYDCYSMTSRDPKQTSGGMLSCITNSRILSKISNEISGACEDTLVSVDQVFNAFTLTDRDIRAVTKRIDKAKRQLET